MSKTLTDIVKQLKDSNKKVQLIYAFNGVGKTRLSREFIPKNDAEDESETPQPKVIYYNAFTEDLFYWDNDLEGDAEPKLIIQPNTFTDWILKQQGDVNIIENFQRYTDKNLTPEFIPKEEVQKDKDGRNVKVTTYREVIFTALKPLSGNTEASEIRIENNIVNNDKDENIKISKGEESNFIWSIFYTLLEEIVSTLNEPDPAKRDGNQFDKLEYVFIDDPVSSLDENHLIELAVSLAELVKNSAFRKDQGVKFVITTHNPLFYNVLWNQFNSNLHEEKPDGSRGKTIYNRDQSSKYRLTKRADGSFELIESNNHSFSYHLFLLSELREAIKTNQIKKYHFNFLRNILEKTATFLGHNHWENLLEKVDGHTDPFASRILNLSSHSAHAGEEIADIKDKDKENLVKLVKFLTKTHGFRQEEA
jgi:wobble nucleotide-excising tRNase